MSSRAWLEITEHNGQTIRVLAKFVFVYRVKAMYVFIYRVKNFVRIHIQGKNYVRIHIQGKKLCTLLMSPVLFICIEY